MTSKQLEEERSRQRDLKKKVDEVEEEKGLTNQQYEAKIAQVQEDMEELKNRLVAVTRYDGFQSFCVVFKFVGLRKRLIAAKLGRTCNCYHARESICLQPSAGKMKPPPNRGKHGTTTKRGITSIC